MSWNDHIMCLRVLSQQVQDFWMDVISLCSMQLKKRKQWDFGVDPKILSFNKCERKYIDLALRCIFLLTEKMYWFTQTSYLLVIPRLFCTTCCFIQEPWHSHKHISLCCVMYSKHPHSFKRHIFDTQWEHWNLLWSH